MGVCCIFCYLQPYFLTSTAFLKILTLCGWLSILSADLSAAAESGALLPHHGRVTAQASEASLNFRGYEAFDTLQ